MSGLITVAVLLEKYVVPFFFVIGLMYFIYGCVEYFIIGPGDPGRAQRGREMLLKAISWFVISLVAYLLVVGIAWLGNLSLSGGSVAPEADGGAKVDKNEAILQVPNVPTR